jgi:Protein of unknown function (DUF1302)
VAPDFLRGYKRSVVRGFALAGVVARAGWLSALLAGSAGLFGAASGARAVELLHGRAQLHGSAEVALRGLSSGFSEELDLAQWYNVINLELELDLLPHAVGPIDRIQATVRAEGRYDAIYSRGFGVFGSIDTYGDFANRLPKRLRNAVDTEYGGTQAAVDRYGDFAHPRIADKKPAPIGTDCRFKNGAATDIGGNPNPRCVPGEREGYPGFDVLFRQTGHDNVIGSDDDPARYYLSDVLDFKFAYRNRAGADSSAATNTQILGPWLPRNFVRALAVARDRANPFRGRVPANSFRSVFGAADPDALRYYEGDAGIPAGYTGRIDPLDPRLAVLRDASDSVLTDFPFRNPYPNGLPSFTSLLNEVLDVARFGGDFSGVVPCVDPLDEALADPIRNGAVPAGPGTRCAPGATDSASGQVVTSASVQRIGGGVGENPFRPAPDVSNLEAGQSKRVAQGVYLPSRGLLRELSRNVFDDPDFNFDQVDRSFNRGAAQQRTKELKEAYIDIEAFEGRLWARLGLQNIVWGKTELFRTTDQFNPQDLALSSLPTLEESRIALWSARAVYSLYDVGPLEDVRVEAAANLDRFVPDDLGACGEPYTADAACAMTAGLFTHGLFGTGLAGVDRPDAPWQDPSGLEFGGRIEWRWDRFSFALSDFYGFEDVPYADAIFFYERNVDPATGRPLAARLANGAVGTCARAGEDALDRTRGLVYNTSFASHQLSVTPGARLAPGFPMVRGGIGMDADCLRPGGAVGEANAYRLDPDAVVARTNALYNHHANQQLFAFLCGASIGIYSAFDPGACAWTIFDTSEPIVQGSPGLDFPFVEVVSWILSGEPSAQGSQTLLSVANNLTKNNAQNGSLFAVPLASTNSLQNDPAAPIGTPTAARPDPREGFDGFSTLTDPFRPVKQSLDSTLTNEQRALLGCGPFYGSRCDTSVGFSQYGAFGGIDLLNAEASALLQAWPGFEGTRPGQFATSNVPQPGTIGALVPTADPSLRVAEGFLGGPVCTRYDASRGLIKLPGCRGIESLQVRYDAGGDPAQVEVTFESGYLPSIDGCVLGTRIRRSNGDVVPVVAAGGAATLALELPHCNTALRRAPVPAQRITGFGANGEPITVPNDEILPGDSQPVIDASGRCTVDAITPYQPFGAGVRGFRVCNAQTLTLEQLPLIHPLAGCTASVLNPNGDALCDFWMNRDLVEEFFAGTGQMFQNELASVSWNLLMFLAVGSCDIRQVDLDGSDRRGRDGNPALADDPECYNPRTPYSTTRCSFNAPQFCRNVKAFFNTAGVQRNTLRAAGNERFGRRTFIWQSGGEAVLRYQQRNVLGFATDFAEDRSKTNWGVEFTWIESVPFADNDSLSGISRSDLYNLTLSVDRPTFIHFLNPNRTFFFNTQWFFNYVPEYHRGFTSNGPLNALFTFTAFTGYYQDRMMPQLVTLYDVRSHSGGVLPSLQYRFTDTFSVTVGLLYFFGHTQLVDMPVQGLAPASNRAGSDAYKIGVDNAVSAIRHRDEVFMRLRWAF